MTVGSNVNDEGTPPVKPKKIVPEDETAVAPGQSQEVETRPADSGTSPDKVTEPAYGFWLAGLALVLVTLAALAALLIFRTAFENASDVTTVLGSLFTVVGTVVGTYFGIKTSGDTRDKLQSSIDKAHDTTNHALAELSPESGKRVLEGRS